MIVQRKPSPDQQPLLSATAAADPSLPEGKGRLTASSNTLTSILLLSSAQLPSWHDRNPFILRGYRSASGSILGCLRSLAYVHNETVNIYSHLIPAGAALLGNYLLARHFAERFPNSSWHDRFLLHLFLTTSFVCFALSSAYHTLLCHSATYASLWVRLDYSGIVLQILGSFLSGIYISFYCEPRLQRLYWSMIGTLCLITIIVVLHPKLQNRRWRSVRLTAFVATGLSAFAPIGHAILIFPYDQLDKQSGLTYYYLEGLLFLVGAFFYASHFPESWKQGLFDIWGASHQIFHIFVVAGAAVHLYGLLQAFAWNYENPRCPAPGLGGLHH